MALFVLLLEDEDEEQQQEDAQPRRPVGSDRGEHPPTPTQAGIQPGVSTAPALPLLSFPLPPFFLQL